MPLAVPFTRRRWVRRSFGSLVTVGAFVALAAFSFGGLSKTTGTAGVLVGAVVVAGFFAFRALSRFLGRATTVAAFALTGATLMGLWSALAPTCPGAGAGAGRCTLAEAGTWTLTGAMYPVAYLAVLGVPLLGAGAARRVLSWTRRFAHRLTARLRRRAPGRP